MTDKIIIECDCGGEMLKVESDFDLINDKSVQSIYFAMFGYGNGKRSFRKRLQIAWKMLWKDEVYRDQLIFNPEEATKLKDFLNKNVK